MEQKNRNRLEDFITPVCIYQSVCLSFIPRFLFFTTKTLLRPGLRHVDVQWNTNIKVILFLNGRRLKKNSNRRRRMMTSIFLKMEDNLKKIQVEDDGR